MWLILDGFEPFSIGGIGKAAFVCSHEKFLVICVGKPSPIASRIRIQGITKGISRRCHEGISFF